MKTTTLKQTATIPASPQEVYDALMTSKAHTAFTGEKAVIGKKVGDSYSAYGGYITGKNIELIPGKKIVQSWVAVEELWPDGHESKITFTLKPKGKSTVIHFVHEDLPEVIAKNFVSGWKDYYWGPMKMYFSGK
ncbi:MAG TPA: SRPBCC domain-containing protein [Bacteroidia bacterium]|nr:SRPBCC domain-containing protein [Bacteroidia bacterium]